MAGRDRTQRMTILSPVVLGRLLTRTANSNSDFLVKLHTQKEQYYETSKTAMGGAEF